MMFQQGAQVIDRPQILRRLVRRVVRVHEVLRESAERHFHVVMGKSLLTHYWDGRVE